MKYINHFPHQEHTLYLNHASISPLSQPVIATLTQYLQERQGEHIENFFAIQPALQEAKARFARLLNASPDCIAFVANTSSGFNLLAQGFPWQTQERILLNRFEFPANVYPFLNLKPKGVSVDFVESKGYYLDLSDFEKALTPDTRWVSVSHVQFLTGQRIDLKALGKICHSNGTYLAVDGIQSLGATKIDVEDCGIDFVACGSHKWLMAPAGLGMVYVSKRLQNQLKQASVGWLSVENEWDILDYQLSLKPGAERYELGTPNLMAICGLNASLGLFEETGMIEVERLVTRNAEILIRQFKQWGLQMLTPESSSEFLGIVSVQLENAQEIYDALKIHKVETSVREGQFLRIAPHFYNTVDEIERVLTLIQPLLSLK